PYCVRLQLSLMWLGAKTAGREMPPIRPTRLLTSPAIACRGNREGWHGRSFGIDRTVAIGQGGAGYPFLPHRASGFGRGRWKDRGGQQTSCRDGRAPHGRPARECGAVRSHTPAG